MYQLKSDASVDRTRLFVETCTSLAPSAENLSLVRSASTLVRRVLDGADIAPLREFLRVAQQTCPDVDDVLAAAGQSVVDQMEQSPRAALYDTIHRVAQIERDAFAGLRRSMEGSIRVAYAG